MSQRELELAWVKGELGTVTFRFGDSVRVVTGPDAPASGRIVALLAVAPEPQYVLELGDGESLVAKQQELERGA